MMPKPTGCKQNEDGSIYLEFSIADDPELKRTGSYYVRGAVAWPEINPVTCLAKGHVLMAAQHIVSKVLVVFESTPFSTVEHIMGEDGRIAVPGLWSWMNAVYTKYLGFQYWWTGSQQTHMQYLLQVIRCESIRPQPTFSEIFIGKDMEDAVNILYHWKTTGRIVIDPDALLVRDLEIWEANRREAMLPSITALVTLVNGYERYPFRKAITDEA